MKEKQMKKKHFPTYLPNQKNTGYGYSKQTILRMASVQGKLQNKNEK